VGWFKKIVGGVKDVAKLASYYVAAPVNSLTGHKYNVKYETGFGNAFGKTFESFVDNQHALLKGWADGLLGGLPSRFANVFRSDANKESPGHYLENSKDYGNKFLNGLNRLSSKIGGLWGGKNSGSGPGVSSQPAGVASLVDSGTLKFWSVVVGVFLIVALIIRKL
jgi:hypothetical protein